MIRRPLNERFADKVLRGVKVTTIRDKPWPLGVPIMLFRWAGKPYRSKQINIAPVVVESVNRVWLHHHNDGRMGYSHGQLWVTEGFDSAEDMANWFRPLVKRGDDVAKTLMQFRLYTPQS